MGFFRQNLAKVKTTGRPCGTEHGGEGLAVGLKFCGWGLVKLEDLSLLLVSVDFKFKFCYG